MTAPQILRMDSDEAVARRAAEILTARLQDALATRGAAHLAVSGGRTPKRCFELLGPLVGDWWGIDVWFADERCVGPEDPESNARLVRETLEAPGAVVHRMKGELGAEEAARAYERDLGDVVLDVVLLGIGEDGHTASLFPHNAALDAAGRVAAVHDSPKPPPDRITLTRPTIDGARQRVLLATGSGKAQALAGALGDPTPAVPSSLLRREGLTVIADAEALAVAGAGAGEGAGAG
jgi:6-phosphogluconolactonase